MNGLMSHLGEVEAVVTAVAAKPRTADVLICTPPTLIARAAQIAAGRIEIGGQDCHSATAGAFTGDISAEMLKDAGAAAVIVGHSERRHYHGQTDAMVRAKAQAAQRAGLVPIVCVGETRGQRDDGQTMAVIAAQLDGSLPDAADFAVAYEPVWAIGSGQTPRPQDVAEVHGLIRDRLRSRQ